MRIGRLFWIAAGMVTGVFGAIFLLRGLTGQPLLPPVAAPADW